MKKFVVMLTGAIMLLTACNKEQLEDFSNRLKVLEEDNRVATVEGIIKNINNSINSLTNANLTLQQNIYTLQSNHSIKQKSLHDADSILGISIESLKQYLNEKIEEEENWYQMAFATISQYNALCDEMAVVSNLIGGKNEAVDEALANVESSMKAMVNQKLTAYSNIAQADLRIGNQKDSLDQVIEARKNELVQMISEINLDDLTIIGTDYKIDSVRLARIDSMVQDSYEAIVALDLLQATASEKLAGYDDIIAQSREALMSEYQTALDEAINNYKGVFPAELANSLDEFNLSIEGKMKALTDSVDVISVKVDSLEAGIDTIRAKVPDLQTYLDELRDEINNLRSRLQSISFIPQYSDGKATVSSEGVLTMDFRVNPAEASSEIIHKWIDNHDAVTAKARGIATKAAGDIVNLPVSGVTQTSAGIIRITIDASEIGDAVEGYCVMVYIKYDDVELGSSPVLLYKNQEEGEE